MVLGIPIQLDDSAIPQDESSPGGFWYCPCAVGFDDALEFNRFGGPGRLSSLINACKWLDARRWQLVDEPALKRLDQEGAG